MKRHGKQQNDKKVTTTNMPNTNSPSDEGLCCVCFRKVDIYSIGECNHPVCYNCCTRMRVLCNTTECAMCRKDMEFVIFTTSSQPYATMNTKNMNLERKFSIYFATEQIMNAYDKLLEHICKECPTVNKFNKFCDLEKHMIEVHSRYFCHLCIQNLKCFTDERKYYTLDLLRVHRNKGDADDKSHRGHPLCLFCNERFLDRDTLHLHLRRTHYHCHFCNADGGQEFFNDYDDLRKHFRKEHCLCEEGDCAHERFITVFRTKLDLQAHWSQTHAHTVSRQEARQGRTIETEFRMFWSNNERGRSGRNNGPGRMGHGTRTDQDLEDQEWAAAAPPPSVGSQKPVNIKSAQDFPTLGGAPEPMVDDDATGRGKSMSQRFAEQNRFSVRSGNRNLTQEDFPLLTSSRVSNEAAPPTAASVSVNLNGKPTAVAGAHSNVNIQYKKRRPGNEEEKRPQIGNITHSGNITMAGGRPPKVSTENFPALGGGGACAYENPTWVKPKGAANSNQPKKTPKLEKARPSKPNLQALNDFPSLGGASGDLQRVLSYTGKSSVAVPMKNAAPLKKTVPVSSPLRAIQNDVDNKSKDNRVRSKKKINLSNVYEDPDVDLTMTRLGDYESLSASRAPNVSIVREEDMRRSELKIGELSAPKFKKDDFPSLGMGATVPEETCEPSWKSKLLRRKTGDIKFTSSLGHQYDISTLPVCEFRSPPNFNERNLALISTIKTQCNNDAAKFDRFKAVSADLQHERLDYMGFYNRCKQIMGKAKFLVVFPELLVLLPNIAAQQGILEQYKRTDGTRNGIMFAICSTCQQVLLPEDFGVHAQSHVFN